MGFLLTIEGMIVASAVFSLVLTIILRLESAMGCLVVAIFPLAAAFLAWLRLENLPSDMLSSTSALEIPFAAIWSTIGTFLGFLGGIAVNVRRIDGKRDE